MLKVLITEIQKLISDELTFRIGVEIIACLLSGYIAVKIRGICQQFWIALLRVGKIISVLVELDCLDKDVIVWLKDDTKNGGKPPGKIQCPTSSDSTKD